MSAILQSLGMTADDVSRLCEKYGRRVEPARPRPIDLTGCRFHRVVELAASRADSATTTEGGAQ